MTRVEHFVNVVKPVDENEQVWVKFPDPTYAEFTVREPINLGPVLDVINACDDPKKDTEGKDSGLSYIVYRSLPDQFRVAYATGPGHRDPGRQFNLLWTQIRNLEYLAKASLTDEQLESLSSQIGNAVGNGLEGDPEGMKEGLNQARRFVWGISRRKGRRPYLLSLLGVAIASAWLGLYLLGYTCGDSAGCACESDCDSWSRILGAGLLGGSLGSILFSATLKTLPFDPFASSWQYVVFEGGLRVVFGVVGAIIVALAVSTGLITTELINLEKNEMLVLVLFSVAGGYSERLAPALLRTLSPVEEPPDE